MPLLTIQKRLFCFSSNFLHFFLVKKQQMLLFLIDELFNDI